VPYTTTTLRGDVILSERSVRAKDLRQSQDEILRRKERSSE
jgi:hypothetical protein